jgi:diguanylate cyclase (GGDEF)-like protein
MNLYNIHSEQQKMATPFQHKNGIAAINGQSLQTDQAASTEYGSRAFFDIRAHLIQTLQTTLDINDILKIFFNEIQAAVPIDGLNFQHPAYELEIEHGEKARHNCSYRLISEKNVLGNISFTRKERFIEQELCVLEALISTLICPLRNGLMYLEALQTALKDPLTGLGSRAALENALAHDLSMAQRHRYPFSMMILDIDKFKLINDKHGHSAGDVVLKEIANAVQEAIRQTDRAFRFGGEEIVVILEKTDEEGAANIAERIRQSIENLLPTYRTQSIPTTASFGVSSVTEGDTVQSLFDRADQALYFAKENGRNRVIRSSLLESSVEV